MITHEKMVKVNIDQAGIWLGIGGCMGLCPAANGHDLVTLFPCLCRLRTGRCIGR